MLWGVVCLPTRECVGSIWVWGLYSRMWHLLTCDLSCIFLEFQAIRAQTLGRSGSCCKLRTHAPYKQTERFLIIIIIIILDVNLRDFSLRALVGIRVYALPVLMYPFMVRMGALV